MRKQAVIDFSNEYYEMSRKGKRKSKKVVKGRIASKAKSARVNVSWQEVEKSARASMEMNERPVNKKSKLTGVGCYINVDKRFAVLNVSVWCPIL